MSDKKLYRIGKLVFPANGDVLESLYCYLGIPKRYRRGGERLFENGLKPYWLAALSKVKQGRGVFLYGIPGCGKTTMATALYVYAATQYGGGLWVSHAGLIADERRSFEAVNEAATVPVLMLDDFGIISKTAWAQERTAMLIAERYDNERMTIITSNFTPDYLAEQWGKPIIDKLCELAAPIEMPRINFRERQG